MEMIKNSSKLKISVFLSEVKPTKNLNEELNKKNALFEHPEYIRIMNERGLTRKRREN